MSINWETNDDGKTYALSNRIAERLAKRKENIYDKTNVVMDIAAFHLNDTNLNLQKMLEYKIEDLVVDYLRIKLNLDRKTGVSRVDLSDLNCNLVESNSDYLETIPT